MIPSKGTNKQSNEGEERVKYQERGGEAEARRGESSDGRGGESGVGWRRRGGGGGPSTAAVAVEANAIAMVSDRARVK